MQKNNSKKTPSNLATKVIKLLSLTAVLSLSFNAMAAPINGTGNITPVSYTHLTLPTNREV